MKPAPPAANPTEGAPTSALSSAALEQLSAYDTGELDDAAAGETRALLARSAEARRVLARLARLSAARPTLTEPGLSSARKIALGDRIEAAVRARRRRQLVTVAAALGAAAAAIIVAVALPRGSTLSDDRTRRTHLRTGAGEFQLLPIGERAVAFVGEDTELEAEPGGQPAIRLTRGTVRLMVRRGIDEPFVVSTPAAEIAVLGTEFDVSVLNEETEVSVVRGEVEVRNPHGQRRLWAREAARARAGAPPRLWVPPRGVVTEGAPEIHPAPVPR